jgi:hypothetical protein
MFARRQTSFGIELEKMKIILSKGVIKKMSKKMRRDHNLYYLKKYS